MLCPGLLASRSKIGEQGMAVFCDTQNLHEVMVELWQQIIDDPKTAEKLKKSKLVVRFTYNDPDGVITIDGSNGEDLIILAGPSGKAADVEFMMKSDVAHKFWLGKEPIVVSMMQGRVKSKGPVNKALALLPAIKPAFDIYPQIIEAHFAQNTNARSA